MSEETSRYELVSRRAILKASAGLGIAIVLPAACGNGDTTVFAGATTDPVSPTLPTTAPIISSPAESANTTEAELEAPTPPPPTETPLAEPTAEPTAQPTAEPAPDPTVEPTAEPTTQPTAESAPDPTVEPTAEPTAQPTAEQSTEPTGSPVAVAGEMIISFTYTQGVGGKNERPYIAVWIEDAAGDLAATVSLWYQQVRRGARWLDHLDRWYMVDQNRQARGDIDNVAAVTSATRQAGSHAVAWDGTVAGAAAPSGSYFVCIESAREEGPYSLIREPITLTGTLADTPLPDNGELSAARIRIDV